MSHRNASRRGVLGALTARLCRHRLYWRVFELVVAFALVGVAALGLTGCTVQIGTQAEETASTTTSTTAVESPSTTTTSEAVAPITPTTGRPNVVPSGQGMASPAVQVAQILGPSVVNIRVRSTYLRGPWQQDYQAEGSGVIYTADGIIITNNHVVTDNYGDPVDEVIVTLATGETLPARIVGRDPVTDLAVIRVKPKFSLPAATFVTDPPTVGEYAIAIGSPLGYENSVTLGIVSGLDRSIEGVYGPEAAALTGLIQTDAPISPGNSGGALANASGQVIGINVAYEAPQTGAVSIGFAIPSAVVVKVADEIIKTGKATHAYLGVSTVTVTEQLQRQFRLSRSSGILVAEVTPNGPADKAGIKQGDIIIKIDDQEMKESSDVLMAVRDRKPGEQVKVTLDRDGQEIVVTVTLEERPQGL